MLRPPWRSCSVGPPRRRTMLLWFRADKKKGSVARARGIPAHTASPCRSVTSVRRCQRSRTLDVIGCESPHVLRGIIIWQVFEVILMHIGLILRNKYRSKL